jgi:hypothetical protein
MANPPAGKLFEEALRKSLEELRALGWKEISRFGRTYWENPFNHAWLEEKDALRWLEDWKASQGHKP